MGDDELRLAAGTLLAEIDAYARAYSRHEYGLPLDGEHMAELVAIVRPYLAQNPADDEAPITPDRSAALGFEVFGVLRDYQGGLRLGSLEWWQCETWMWHGYTLDRQPQVMGDLRRLISALGETP